MKLKKLIIKNFKCFKKQQILDFERLTILTGANSSGKSSILYSILGSLQSGEYPFQFSTNGKYINMGDFKEISNCHIINNEIKIGFTLENKRKYNIVTTWKEDKKNNLPELQSLEADSEYFKVTIKKNNKYVFSIMYDPDKDIEIEKDREKLKKFIENFTNLIVEEKKISSKSKTKLPVAEDIYRDLTEKLDIKSLEFKNYKLLIKYLKSDHKFRLKRIIDTLIDLFNDFDEKVNFISSFRLNPERTELEKSKSMLKIEKFGEGYLDQIILWEKNKSIKFKELISTMKSLSLLYDIKTKRLQGGRVELLIKTKNKGILTSLSDVGFGISQFLPIIVADLQLPKDSTFFIAQPEIHLHPSVQSLFGKYIVDKIKKTDKNYIIETHSEYLLNRIRLAIVNGELKESDLAVYYIDNNRCDANIKKIQFTKEGQIKNAPKGFFKTYMIDVMKIAMSAVK